MGIRISEGMAVSITYRMTDESGRVMEERSPENPYEYIQGGGQIVAPLERVVEGKTAGFQAEITISPREGYGEYDASLVTEVPRAHLPADIEVVVGMKFNTVGPTGAPMIVRVTSVEDGVVTLDGNHPLAGLVLNFDLRVLDVRDPAAVGEAGPKVSVTMRKRTSGTH